MNPWGVFTTKGIVVCRLMRIRVFSRLIIATWHYQKYNALSNKTLESKKSNSIGWTVHYSP